MGIEPTRGRVNDPSSALKAGGLVASESSQTPSAQAVTSTGDDAEKPHCSTYCTKLPPKPESGELSVEALTPELRTVVEAWPGLTEAVRARIVGIVEGASLET